jgi:hypothetical protein
MTPRLVVRSAAEADIAAALWYEERATGLGTEFLRAVDVTLAEIRRLPERFPMVHLQCRRALLRRFPYAVLLRPVGRPDQRRCLHARAPRTAPVGGARR